MAVAKPRYEAPVRELVEFVLRQGDLGGEREFVGRGRALAGTRGHQRVQRSRPEGYLKEVSLFHEIETEDFILRVSGRIDGLLVTGDQVLLEEIKTVQGHWDGAANPLHWAQAKIYGYIYGQRENLERIALQLTYLHLDTGELTEFRESPTFAELCAFFQATVSVYLEWIRELNQFRQLRDASIQALKFPFPRYRPGQRELAVAAYRTMARGGRLFLEAPTGIGKTISVLLPSVKALGENKVERIYYLTARTVGRGIAEKAFADLRQAGLRLRTLTLTAREKICVQAGQPCDPHLCPLARGYYDHLKPAMRAALGREEITRPAIEAVAREHQVCPFELALDIASWVDAVIGDYNHVFDPAAYLRRHFSEQAENYVFLIDEAHNLVDRARDMFSADLEGRELRALARAVKPAAPGCAKALNRLSTALRKACLTSEALEPAEPADLPELDLFAFAKEVVPKILASSTGPTRLTSPTLRTTRDLPQDWLPLLEDALDEAEAWLVQNQPADFREELLQLFFRLLAFSRTAELYNERFVTILDSAQGGRVRLFCLDPSQLLAEGLARGKSAIFFSATLAPVDYYRTLLGGAESDPSLQLDSPFAPENLAVLMHDRIRTQYKHREGTLGEVVRMIGAFVAERRGNYLVYLPSYQYLTAAQEQFRAACPEVALLVQSPKMTEPEREAFLAAFRADHDQTLVGFAVLGGIFGEGIDLVGDRLIGAVIVGVGLPQLCVERDLIRGYFDETQGSGFDYAYTFPGMNRVLQASGRVIRSETDRGAVLLIDTRFNETRYRRLFPKWWHPQRVRSENDVRQAVRSFWEKDHG